MYPAPALGWYERTGRRRPRFVVPLLPRVSVVELIVHRDRSVTLHVRSGEDRIQRRFVIDGQRLSRSCLIISKACVGLSLLRNQFVAVRQGLQNCSVAYARRRS